MALSAGALFAPAASAAPVLYGATGVTALDTTPASNLYTINPDTGATTSVGSIGKAVTGLAVDGTDGKLYGVTAGVQLDGSERQLLSINPATGASTVIGSLGVNEIEDIAFSPLGQLYGWNETGDDLYRINKAHRRDREGRRVGPGRDVRRRPLVRPQRRALGSARRRLRARLQDRPGHAAR